MSRYIKAERGLNHSIIYTDDLGRYFRFSGGTWAWRNHNPGNLVPGDVSSRHSQIGTTGKFAIFPDYETGHEALLDCLQTTYAKASIDKLDLVMCISQQGHQYLRARVGSSVNGSLDKMIVKNPKVKIDAVY